MKPIMEKLYDFSTDDADVEVYTIPVGSNWTWSESASIFDPETGQLISGFHQHQAAIRVVRPKEKS